MLLMMWVESSRCFSGAYTQRLDDPLRGLLESQPATVRAASGELGSCVASSGGGGVSSISSPQGEVPEQIELQLF